MNLGLVVVRREEWQDDKGKDLYAVWLRLTGPTVDQTPMKVYVSSTLYPQLPLGKKLDITGI